MPKIFINYRRDDEPATARLLHRDLCERFGEENVFFDAESIEAGADFSQRIDEAVTSSDVFLTLIGPGWLDAKGRFGQRRLEDPQDWVRLEIHSALKNEAVRVLPICVEGARMPEARELPGDLSRLAMLNALDLQTRGKSYRRQVDEICGFIERSAPTSGASRADGDSSGRDLYRQTFENLLLNDGVIDEGERDVLQKLAITCGLGLQEVRDIEHGVRDAVASRQRAAKEARDVEQGARASVDTPQSGGGGQSFAVVSLLLAAVGLGYVALHFSGFAAPDDPPDIIQPRLDIHTPPPGGAQPGWCTNGRQQNPNESMICETPELWPLDNTHRETFKRLKDGLPVEQSKALERENERRRSGGRNNCRGDRDCTARWYDEWGYRMNTCYGTNLPVDVGQICAEEGLWAMELQNRALFKRLRDNPRSGSLQKIQLGNMSRLKARRACGRNSDCLGAWYTANIARLKGALIEIGVTDLASPTGVDSVNEAGAAVQEEEEEPCVAVAEWVGKWTLTTEVTGSLNNRAVGMNGYYEMTVRATGEACDLRASLEKRGYGRGALTASQALQGAASLAPVSLNGVDHRHMAVELTGPKETIPMKVYLRSDGGGLVGVWHYDGAAWRKNELRGILLARRAPTTISAVPSGGAWSDLRAFFERCPVEELEFDGGAGLACSPGLESDDDAQPELDEEEFDPWALEEMYEDEWEGEEYGDCLPEGEECHADGDCCSEICEEEICQGEDEGSELEGDFAPEDATFSARLSRWLNEPGVNFVGVEMFSESCVPCKETAPRWGNLRSQFEGRGLKLVAINLDAEDTANSCDILAWRPHETLCGRNLGVELGACEGPGSCNPLRKELGLCGDASPCALPRAFLWSRDGTRLVGDKGNHFEAVEDALRRHMTQMDP